MAVEHWSSPSVQTATGSAFAGSPSSGALATPASIEPVVIDESLALGVPGSWGVPIPFRIPDDDREPIASAELPPAADDPAVVAEVVPATPAPV
jgi:hypothetical protein